VGIVHRGALTCATRCAKGSIRGAEVVVTVVMMMTVMSA
jgi:hypothetical protein